jgi:hypothetical protein
MAAKKKRRRKLPTDEQMMEAAFEIHHRDGEVEVDVMPTGKKYLPTARVSRSEDNEDKGAYVLAWVWVYDDDTRRIAREARRVHPKKQKG